MSIIIFNYAIVTYSLEKCCSLSLICKLLNYNYNYELSAIVLILSSGILTCLSLDRRVHPDEKIVLYIYGILYIYAKYD